MTENDKSWLETKIEALFKKHSKIVNLMVADAAGKNLDFGTQIETPEQIAVGMTAVYEDGTKPMGDVVMPDGKTLVFDESGIITEIKEAEGDPLEVEIEALEAEIEALKTEKEGLKAELEASKIAQAKLEADHVLNLKNVKAQITSEMLAIVEESYVKKPEPETKENFVFKGKK
jgi:SMC interacting uncharacterized protein involved in chromosome segregation